MGDAHLFLHQAVAETCKRECRAFGRNRWASFIMTAILGEIAAECCWRGAA